MKSLREKSALKIEIYLIHSFFCAAVLCLVASVPRPTAAAETNAFSISPNFAGLHGYIAYGHEKFPPQSAFTAGMGFYSAVWPLVNQPLAGFQIDERVRRRLWSQSAASQPFLFLDGVLLIGREVFELFATIVSHGKCYLRRR